MKTTFSVTMTIPAHLCALSNMPELSVTHLSGKLKKVVFDKTPKMSTYLLAFAVGKRQLLLLSVLVSAGIA